MYECECSTILQSSTVTASYCVSDFPPIRSVLYVNPNGVLKNNIVVDMTKGLLVHILIRV